MSKAIVRIWDVETGTHTFMKRKSSPFCPNNYVVASGWKNLGEDKVHGEYFSTNKRPFDWFTKLLDNTTLLVGFNIKFDILYALQEPQNYEAWKKFVARGGNVWDCQQAEYLLEGMASESHMLSLEETAIRYGGSLKVDEVKLLWEAGVDTPDIDEDLLMRYLCGGVDINGEYQHGDIGNTELVFKAQLARAREGGQVKSILLNMGATLCITEMELNGLKVDMELGMSLAKELKNRLEELTQTLDSFLPSDLPFEFKWTSRVHLSALIFGGDVKYTQRVPVLDSSGEPTYAIKTEQVPVLDTDGNEVRYKSGKNAGEVKYTNVKYPDFSKPKTRLEEFTYRFPRMTDPNPYWEGATKGVYSTAASVIEELSVRGIPFLDTYAAVGSLVKDLGTYFFVEGEDGKPDKGMLTLVQVDGIIHHYLNTVNTVTGRLSSSNPNLQNLPKEGKSEVKTVFVSRFPDGYIVQSDFTALEVYVQAILTDCQQLIEDLKAKLDMHCVRLAQKEHMEYEEVYRLCMVEKVKEWVAKRTGAKVFSFQRAYGAGKVKIALTTGMTEDEVQALIDAEEARYPEISEFYIELTDTISANRISTGHSVQHPDNPAVWCHLGKSYSRTPDNKLYCYKEQPAPAFKLKHGVAQGFKPTEIKNYVVQGTGAEWAKASMWLAVRAFYAKDNFGGKALLINQVHDALYGDFSAEVKDEAAALMHACMEGTSDFMEWYFGWEIKVPVPSATVYGRNMMEEEPFEEGFFKRAEELRKQLRVDYMENYQPSFLE